MSKEILIRPLVTEKLTRLMGEGHYTFEVDLDANKIQIQRAIQERFPGVFVKEVRTMIVRGKRRRQTTRRGVNEGRTSRYKKAIVTLTPESEHIDFFENI